MSDAPLESTLFPFDDADASLERIPIAARRALDLSGWRVALDAWRAMPWEGRRRVTLAGAAEIVDPFVVEEAVRRAGSSVVRVRPLPDPDPFRAPAELLSALEPARTLAAKTWSNLRALERYALMYALRQAPDRAYLHDVFDDLFPERPTSPPSAAPAPPERPPSGNRPLPRSSAPPSTVAASRDPARTLPPAMSPSVAAGRRSPPGHERSTIPGSIPAPPRVPSELPPPHDAAVSSHLTAAGEVHMVDVGGKTRTARRAVATASVRMKAETLARVARREVEKGEVLATARVAGIQAAKRTSELIPLCHQVSISRVEMHLDVDHAARRIHVTAVVEAFDRTGVEMEAMVAVSVASLTLYDMLKGSDREIIVEHVRLLEKSGGRTGPWRRSDG